MPDISFKLLQSELVPLTPELAQQFHTMPASPTERDLNPLRTKFLRQRILNGMAVPFHWSSAILDGKEFRMNGRHSSGVLCELNGAFPEGLMVHRDLYEVPNMDSTAMLFRQFDARQSGRSPADVAGAYQGLYEPLNEVPRAIAKIGIEGVAWYQRNIMGAVMPQTGDDNYTKFANPLFHPFLRWLGDSISRKTPEMARVPVCAAMYATHEANAPEAEGFWSSVANGGDPFDETAPATTLDTWLKEQKAFRCKIPAKPLELYQGCIYAWTAFREGHAIKTIKWDIKKGIHEVVH